MISGRTNKYGKPHEPNKDYLDVYDIYYIKHHIAQGIPFERIAANVCCDIEDVERVANRPYADRKKLA